MALASPVLLMASPTHKHSQNQEPMPQSTAWYASFGLMQPEMMTIRAPINTR